MRMLPLCLVIQGFNARNFLWASASGLLWAKTLIHENTTSSVLSVLLFIYDHNSLQNQPIFFPLILDNLSRDNLK